MKIRVEEIRKVERGSLRSFAKANVSGTCISHRKIIQAKARSLSFQMPQRSHQTNNGETKYSYVIDLPDDLTRQVERAVLWFWNKQTAHLYAGGRAPRPKRMIGHSFDLIATS